MRLYFFLSTKPNDWTRILVEVNYLILLLAFGASVALILDDLRGFGVEETVAVLLVLAEVVLGRTDGCREDARAKETLRVSSTR